METIEIFLQGQAITDILLLTIDADARVNEIITLAAPQGLAVVDGETLRVWLENCAEPLDPELTLTEAGIGSHSRVHVHHCQQVHVTVNFNGDTHHHPFAPSTTVEVVKAWAVERFRLDPSQALGHVLQLVNTNDRPREDIHIGTLASDPHCTVTFDLVPKQRIEG